MDVNVRSDQEAEVMPVRLGQLHEIDAEDLGRLFDKFFKVDHLVLVRVGLVDDRIHLLLVEEVEAEILQRSAYLKHGVGVGEVSSDTRQCDVSLLSTPPPCPIGRCRPYPHTRTCA